MIPCALLSSPFIPREELFQNFSCKAIKLSPDGKRLAYVEANCEGAMNLFVSSDLTLETAEPLTHFEEPEIKGFHWLVDNQTILVLKDSNGTSKFRLYSVDLNSKKMKDLTADYQNIDAKIFQISPTEMKAVIGINHRNPRFHDLYLLDVKNQTLSPFFQNDQFIHFVFDSDLNVVVKVKMNEDSSLTLFDRNDDVLFPISAEDAFHTECLSYDKLENALYLLDNRGCNTTQLKKITLDQSQQEVLLAQDAQSDITSVYFEEGIPAAYTTYYTQQQWHSFNEIVKADLDRLTSQLGPNFEIISQSNNQAWILKNSIPDRGIEFWYFDRITKSLSALHSPLKIDHLAKMYPLIIPSSDGLNLVSYLTLPKDSDQGGTPSKPLPLVVIPHGGPFKLRDYYEYSNYHQWLANRGYVVLSVNFRLSSGFGKNFVNAGNGQWGKRAHQDILDAVQWCKDANIADPDKVAIFGGSYGGYEALASLTFSPDVFTCAISICGPSSLKTVLDKVPFYWEFPDGPVSDKMVSFTKNAFIISMGGNPDKEEEIPYLQSCSPLHHIDRIQKPLLLVHGVNDAIVAASESDQIFEIMQKKNLPVIYLSFPDEGHGIIKFNNKMCYLAYSEWLLAQFLGGTYEPISQNDLDASSATIRAHKMNPEEVMVKNHP